MERDRLLSVHGSKGFRSLSNWNEMSSRLSFALQYLCQNGGRFPIGCMLETFGILPRENAVWSFVQRQRETAKTAEEAPLLRLPALDGPAKREVIGKTDKNH